MTSTAKITVALLASALLAPSAVGQSRQSANTLKLDRPENQPKARVADLAWLEGTWAGTGLGGTVEETWSHPLGDNILGMFRLVKDGKVVFCELFAVIEVNGTLVAKVKHFDGKLVGWEEKDAAVNFPLVRLTPTEVNFDGLTYRKTDDGNLVAYVVIHRKNGETKEEAFHFQPAAAKAVK
jgi:Domain of unknown function (DUF6265)